MDLRHPRLERGEKRSIDYISVCGSLCTVNRTKWDALVYLDLFAGSGRSPVRGTKRIVNASPLLILGMPEAFHKYIFCEGDKNLC